MNKATFVNQEKSNVERPVLTGTFPELGGGVAVFASEDTGEGENIPETAGFRNFGNGKLCVSQQIPSLGQPVPGQVFVGGHAVKLGE